MIPWHRAFGFTLTDLFWNTNYEVELEKDLSLKQQFLDAIIIEQVSLNNPPEQLPDGFDNLSIHNLLSYKSLREPLDAWAMDELIGHFVNYRKQISPSMNELLPEDQFRLYAVCTRSPKKLDKKTPLQKIQEGVFEVQWGVRLIRVLVLNQMPLSDRNAIWQLFSSTDRGYLFGQQQYQWKIPNISQIIRMLYAREEIEMTYTVEDFQRDLPKELLTMLSKEQRSALIEDLPAEEMIEHLSPQEMIEHLSPQEMIEHLSPQEMIEHLSSSERKKMLDLLSKTREK